MPSWLERLLGRLGQLYEQRFSISGMAEYLQHAFDSAIILLCAAGVIWICRRAIGRIVARTAAIKAETYTRRIETIASLVFSIVKYAIYIASVLWILALWGIETQSLIVGSAVIGAAVGFGSQGLVQDIITGLSILAEEQLAVGDFVEIAGKTGVVEEIGLRVIKIRDQQGAQHVIFNRNVGMVSNYSWDGITTRVDIALKDESAAGRAQEAAEQAGRELAAELPYFLTAPKMEGLVQSSTGDVFLRLQLRVMPNRESAVPEHLVPRLKKALTQKGIEIPGDQVRVITLSNRFRKLLTRPAKAPAGKPAT